MANFDLLKIENISEEDVDTDIRSKAANGLVKTRARFTKTRKKFTLKIANPTTQEEVDELKALYAINRTVTSWVFTHPTETTAGNPTTYQVRFEKPIKITQLGAKANLFSVDDITLEEV